jgi:hypothetical protein
MGETIKLRIKDFVKIPTALAGDPGAAHYVRRLIHKKKLPFPVEKIGNTWYIEVDKRAIPPEILEEIEDNMNRLKAEKAKKRKRLVLYIPKSLLNRYGLENIKLLWKFFLRTLYDKEIRKKYFAKRRMQFVLPDWAEEFVDNKHIGMMFLSYLFEEFLKDKEVKNNANSSTSTLPPGGGESNFQTPRREDTGGVD